MNPCILLLSLTVATSGCESRPAIGATDALAAFDIHGDTTNPRLRRISRVSRDYATPSPDGRLIAFVDWTTGDVAVHDVATGEDRRVTHTGGWEANGSWAEDPLFSPDGRRIVFLYGNVRTGDPFRYELKWVELGDTTQHLLHVLEWDSWMEPVDWDATRGILLRHALPDGSSTLATMSPDDGRMHVIRTFPADESYPRDGLFSADARHIAYTVAGDIRTVGADGQGDRSLGLAPAKLLAWMPDGRILFHAERDGRRGIFAISTEAGRAAGSPVLVRDGIPLLNPAGLAETGYFYGVPVEFPRVFMSAVDVTGGRMLMQPNALTSPGDGGALTPAWSPDGASIAYALRVPDENTRIMLRTSGGDHVRELAQLRSTSGVMDLTWRADGRSLLFIGGGTSEPALYELDVESGAVMKLTEPAGRRIAVVPGTDRVVLEYERRYFLHDLDTGARRQLAVERPSTFEFTVSPDARMLTFIRRDSLGSRIVTMPLEGGAERVIARVGDGMHLEGPAATLAYTTDGSHVLAVRGNAENQHWLVAYDVATGDEKTLLDLGGRPDGPERAHARLHPDGRRVVYSNGYYREELWLMEDIPRTAD